MEQNGVKLITCAVVLNQVTKIFLEGKRTALKQASAEFPLGKITGIVGPDGAGKTTLLRILTGLLPFDKGTCHVLGYDIAQESDKIQESLGYLPQKFGLYEELTVSQNLSLYAHLQGVEQQAPIFKRLMDFSGLEPFQDRLAGKLSGGMKQKLGLMATLLRKPKLLILDEPTIGVDPMAQQEMWKMIKELNQEGMTIIVSTSYLEEPENCDYALLLNEGNVLFAGPPSSFVKTVEKKTYYFMGTHHLKRSILDDLLGKEGIIDTIIQGDKIRVVFSTDHPETHMERYGLEKTAFLEPRPATFEDAFIQKLGGVPKRPPLQFQKRQIFSTNHNQPVVEAKNLSKNFGSFKAVDDVSFSIKEGEIFGLLGPNGAGKSTTFKMLCGLISSTSGEALVGGTHLFDASSKARSLIGYMAQKFSLYDNMTVLQNLTFFSGIYPVEERKRTIEQMIEVFNLNDYQNLFTKDLPLGYKQRLALSCALMHQPHALFLDEPTSGVDPLTRREFWHQINLLASKRVAVLVSTHLMDEAEFCDRIGFIYQGKLQAIDTPEALKKQAANKNLPEPTLWDAFKYFCGGRNL